jgi:hypothetical protein
LHAHLVRLMVLYEDLRLEFLGASEDHMKPLDGTTVNFRKQHFMRAAVGTTIEFAEEFRLLDEFHGFVEIRSKFSAEHLAEWVESVEFFREHEPGLEKIRNDIGGHFGYEAALYAIRNLNPDTTGRIHVELNYARGTGTIWYELAEEIAATAMERRKKKEETSQDFFARTFDILRLCFKHAVRSTDMVSNYYTLDRFR